MSKVAFITGAAGNLGVATVRTLREQGWRVAAADLSGAVAAAVQAPAGPDLLYLPGTDLLRASSVESAIAATVQAFGRLDALVNIAGGFVWETLTQGSVDSWERMYRLNVTTALNATRAALPSISAAGGGSVVMVGAMAAARAALGMGAYAAAKSGVQRLTEALAEEVRDQGIRVNAVLPSILDTPQNRSDMPNAEHGRWVAPEALADVLAFLLSDAARAITGASIPVAGRL